MIRPEDIKIVPPANAKLTGIVKSVVFKGVHYEMTVDGMEHKWIIHSTLHEPVGTMIGMDIAPFDIHIMKKARNEHMKTKWVSAPYLVWMTVFIAVPLLMIAVFAFTTNDGEFTVKNIQDVGQYANIFFRSIWLSVIATAICLVVAYPVSFILSRMEKHKQATMLMIVMLPMWMNFLLRTYAWMTLLGNNGVINHLLGLIGIGPLKLINTSGAVVLGMVYNYLPFMILPLYSVMVKIDKSVIEAASDLGCSGVATLFRVIVPLSLPGITSGVTMVFVPAISTFIISRMLGGGSNLLIGDLIEMQFLGNAYNPHLGAAISLVLMVIILVIMTVMNQFSPDDQVLI